MVRVYKKKSSRGNYSAETISLALSAVQNGSSVRKAAKDYGIHHLTLLRYQQRDSVGLVKPGVSTVFTRDEEKRFVQHIIDCANTFHGLSLIKTKEMAYSYAMEIGKPVPDSWKRNKYAGSVFSLTI